LNTNSTNNRYYTEKTYIALEEEGRIAVVDNESRKLIRIIDLSDIQNEKFVKYSAHNVQVSPDGSKVIATANVVRGDMGNVAEETENISDELKDKIFIIDPLTDTIIGSVLLGIDLHLAHVVMDASGSTAYVNAQEAGKTFVVNLDLQKVTSIYELGEGSGPHGLRITSDNSTLFIALIGGRSVVSIDLKNSDIKKYPLTGRAVQTAVTPDVFSYVGHH